MTRVGSQRHTKKYNYYISNKILLKESDKVGKMEVTAAATTSCLQRKL
jgi:hypothetical protein